MSRLASQTRRLASLILCGGVLTSFGTFAQENTAFSLERGKRTDELAWTIVVVEPTNDINANIGSELHWHDVEISETRLKLESRTSTLAITAALNYGHIDSGYNQDSDYARNNRTMEWSRSISKTSGDTLDFNMSIGVPLSVKWMAAQPTILTPMFGYTQSKQHFEIKNGSQLLEGPPIYDDFVIYDPSNAPKIEGLDSSYGTNWRSGWLGVDAQTPLTSRLSIRATYQYHPVIDYHARAYWNIRDLHFTHDASSGNGYTTSLTLNYAIDGNWQASATYNQLHMRTDAGTDYAYNSTESATTRLNEVDWTSHSVMIGIRWAASNPP